eukprot:CAMPEP_0201126284 /NCGR_PEP_ID=MMETSP0850-20130426/25561_1 /ASSEMBLY_ACC=CAM_ASM_000622 /TAXON_ID=183588 /ORGANISM="Pseudo-nitzschia fraudulenta, Strain WWA7" /LENGTH=76 /DNA_ID=CAMNT_0047394667 /DNA_START=205 /DNA_END=435 /DNA_ORIENTATION=+
MAFIASMKRSKKGKNNEEKPGGAPHEGDEKKEDKVVVTGQRTNRERFPFTSAIFRITISERFLLCFLIMVVMYPDH